MKIGVLALQGDFREHIQAVKMAGHAGLTVRRPEELADIVYIELVEGGLHSRALGGGTR